MIIIIMDYGVNGNGMEGELKQNVLILETGKRHIFYRYTYIESYIIITIIIMKLIYVIIASIMVVVMFVMIAYSPEPFNNIKNSNSVASPSVSTSGVKLIYNQLYQFKGTGGTVYYNFSAYHTSGSNYVIYTVFVYITANSNSGYWVAGDRPNAGQWSGYAAFSNPEYGCNPGATGDISNGKFNQFQPSNTMDEGSAGTITIGISATTGATAYDSSLSGTYSVQCSYNVPMFKLEPVSMTDSNAKLEFSNNQALHCGNPLSTSFSNAVSVKGVGQSNSISVDTAGHFAHHSGWFNLNTNYYWVTHSYSYEINK